MQTADHGALPGLPHPHEHTQVEEDQAHQWQQDREHQVEVLLIDLERAVCFYDSMCL